MEKYLISISIFKENILKNKKKVFNVYHCKKFAKYLCIFFCFRRFQALFKVFYFEKKNF